MKQRIKREYVLTVDEVKEALWRYLKEHCDRPVPAAPKELHFTWNADGEAFISFSDNYQYNAA